VSALGGEELGVDRTRTFFDSAELEALMQRRNFLQGSLTLAGVALASRVGRSAPALAKKTLKLRFRPYTLQLKHAFTLATSSRSTTPVTLTEIEYDGIVGYGEASMPPYLGESHQTVGDFLTRVDLSQFSDPFQIEDILTYVDGLAPGNPAAKAAVDIALHDLVGRLLGKPLYAVWGYDAARTPLTSFTIGIDTPDVIRQKTREAAAFKILKL
jgi:L-alanine-DL-glutamate epimerase-like enolase superfamily enzyme